MLFSGQLYCNESFVNVISHFLSQNTPLYKFNAFFLASTTHLSQSVAVVFVIWSATAKLAHILFPSSQFHR